PKKALSPRTTSIKDETTKDDEVLQENFEDETGKKAIWRGKETKAYSDWKIEKLG
ncbi:hypothetical protein LCGC14_0911660, partial [marine sediment metagenome]